MSAMSIGDYSVVNAVFGTVTVVRSLISIVVLQSVPHPHTPHSSAAPLMSTRIQWCQLSTSHTSTMTQGECVERRIGYRHGLRTVHATMREKRCFATVPTVGYLRRMTDICENCPGCFGDLKLTFRIILVSLPRMSRQLPRIG